MRIKTKNKYLIAELKKELQKQEVIENTELEIYTKLPIPTFATLLGLPVSRLIEVLRTIGLFKKKEDKPLKKAIDRGYFYVVSSSMSLLTGKPFEVVFITQKGSQKVIHFLTYNK